MSGTVTIQDFERIDIRVGTIVEAQPLPEARKPASAEIDFGPEIGVKARPPRSPCTTRPSSWSAARSRRS